MPVSYNATEVKPRIGLDSLYIAAVTADTPAGYTADTPEPLAPAAQAVLEPVSNSETLPADDQPFEVMTSEGETKVTLTVTGIAPAMRAKLLGRVFDAASGRLWDNSGAVPPYIALSFRSMKSNGSYVYVQFLKGRFEAPKMEAETKGDAPAPKTTELVYTAIRTTYKFNLGSVTDSVKGVTGDQDTTNFSGASFFSQVQTPVVTTPAGLALSSSVPTQGASGISVSADKTMTFNNSLWDSAIYEVSLVKNTDGALAAITVTLDATKKIITVHPTSNLTAATVYQMNYAVTDIYGQHLTGSVRFTTA